MTQKDYKNAIKIYTQYLYHVESIFGAIRDEVWQTKLKLALLYSLNF